MLATAAAAAIVERLPLPLVVGTWLVLWVLYLSFVNAGQLFFGFVWETLLLEAGFLAAFLGSRDVAPLWPAVVAVRWLLFRLEVGAGLIKLRNDEAWRDLTARRYHHETQLIPHRPSRHFHHLPGPAHRLEAAGNHLAQLVVPWALFLPQPITTWAGAAVVVTQLWLMASGNFAWLNLLTITLAVMALHADALRLVLPVDEPPLHDPPPWFTILVVAVAVAMAVIARQPVRNMASRHQVMNASYNRIHLGSSYGLFGRITRERLEVVIEGTIDASPHDDAVWQAYELKAKPGDPARRPRQVAPDHLRLDWLLWFAALSPAYAQSWFSRLAARLLEGDPPTLRLFGTNPFPDEPPHAVRALLYRYRFTTRAERRATGGWWRRELVALYLPPVGRPAPAGHPGGAREAAARPVGGMPAPAVPAFLRRFLHRGLSPRRPPRSAG